MVKRNYKLKDIYDYLLEYYGLEWRLFQIKDFGVKDRGERGVRAWDIGGRSGTELGVIAIVYMGEKQKHIRLRVTNDEFEIYEITPYLHYYKQPEIGWKKFLAERHRQEQTLTK